jgi:hypothetical protein
MKLTHLVFILFNVQAAALLAGCTERFPTGILTPSASVPAATATPTMSGTGMPTGMPSADASVPPPGPIKRTVLDRNPFGNLDPENLFLDGDFELTGRSEQMPWLAFVGMRGQSTLEYESGGRCVSGVRCGSFAKGQFAIGWVASPKTGKIDLSMKVRPLPGAKGEPADACSVVKAYYVNIEASQNAAEFKVTGTDDAGFCNFELRANVIANASSAVYLEFGTDALVDDARAKPLESGAPKATAVQKPFTLEAPLPASARANVDFARQWIKRHQASMRPATGNDTKFPGADKPSPKPE